MWQDIPVNIFYTLSFGLLLIKIYEEDLEGGKKAILASGLIVLTLVLNPDYSLYGVFLILLIHVYQGQWGKLAFAFMALGILFYNVHIQLYAVLAIPIMMTYNGKLGPKIKWFFYVFYPSHIGVLYFMSERLR